MTEDLALWGDEPTRPEKAEPAAAPIADWQVDLLREALGARGLTTMADRQRTIESAAGRPVESLRALTSGEATEVLSSLGQQSTRRSQQSSWDDREEDTWIDRL